VWRCLSTSRTIFDDGRREKRRTTKKAKITSLKRKTSFSYIFLIHPVPFLCCLDLRAGSCANDIYDQTKFINHNQGKKIPSFFSSYATARHVSFEKFHFHTLVMLRAFPMYDFAFHRLSPKRYSLTTSVHRTL